MLRLAEDIAPDADSLDTERFREELRTHRERLLSSTTPSEVARAADAAVSLCESFFERSKSYLSERDAEIGNLVELVHEAMTSLTGSERFHDALEESSARLVKISEIDDLRLLRGKLMAEVTEIKRSIDHQRAENRESYRALTRRVQQLEVRLEQSRQQAAMDPLTEVPNRRSFEQALHRSTQTHDDGGVGFAMGMIDIDDFKRINDLHGHLVGDRVLKCAATTLSEGIRKGDLLARYGGEEFAILLADTPLKKARERLSELVVRIASTRYRYAQGSDSKYVSFTVSVGVAEHARGESPEDLVRRADEALYRAKHQGKNTVVVKRRNLFGLLA